ncbi:MAG TPA: family 20 glycosylhydrolase [Fimbriimonadaceae bacterium]|nr:family 20 glycosylhydrolase [Fimbriimonadaceae bacterium]
MQLRMWMLDVAREQAPTLDHLRQYVQLTQEAGFDALGLYLEHRFAYPSTPWAHGEGCVTPDMIRTLRKEFPGIQLIPFVNLLGHFEGMLYTEHGKRYREELFQGMQADPSNPEFVRLAESILDDAVEIFDSEIVHIGGDETWQLGACPNCRALVEGAGEGKDGKALVYGRHFGPLAERVIRAGRRPAVWGDMFLDHPDALEWMPEETLVFDWQYFKGCRETSRRFVERGFAVVGCPALHTYNATWMHIPQSEQNVREVTGDVEALGAYGVCVTTWENGLFGAYDTLFPAIRACGEIVRGGDGRFLASYLRQGERHEEWARLMGCELQEAGGTFAFGGIRSSLKVRLLLNANPFLAWLHHADELGGNVGERALDIIERAIAVAPDEATKGVSRFARGAVEFVRLAEEARREYAEGRPESAIGKLAPTRLIFEELGRIARDTHQRIGGSLADIERARVAKEHVERVIQRIRQFGDGSLGYLPAFEHLTHHKFMPHDQAAWWLINRWANQ